MTSPAIQNGVKQLVAGLRKAAVRYLDEFMRLRAAVDLLQLGVFPNGKEITESMGAFQAVRRHVPFRLSDPDVVCFCVGDGSTPRTGALMAFRSAWTIVSIDPALKGDWSHIKRLDAVKAKVEDTSHVGRKIVIVAVHAHCTLDAMLAAIRPLEEDHEVVGERHLVAMPCCVKQMVANGRGPDVEYEDESVWSPMNVVRVWRNI